MSSWPATTTKRPWPRSPPRPRCSRKRPKRVKRRKAPRRPRARKRRPTKPPSRKPNRNKPPGEGRGFAMLIIAGLGNPEAKYAHNRHNLGFLTLGAIARRWGFGPERARFQALAAEGEVETAAGPVKTLLLKPQTYYNDSGLAVGQAMRFYKLKPADVVVFYDEIDLAPGRFRMKTGGGAAGNNGVRSIAAWLDDDGFRR